MSHIPQNLNQDLGRPSVTEIEIDYDFPSGNIDITIPNLCFVDKVIVATEKAFVGGNPTMTAGDSGDVDAFLANADLVPGTVGAVANSAVIATNANQEGKFYPDGGTLRLPWTKNASSTAGKYRVLVYSRTA